MTPGKVEIVGISLSEEGGEYRPQAVLETSISEISTETAGKFFVGLKVLEDGDIILGLEVDGAPVEVVSNKDKSGNQVRKEQSNDRKCKSMALDLPMRIIGNEKQKFPADHSIKILWGNMVEGAPKWVDAQTFTLRITGTAPVVKYDPVKDGE